MRMTDFSPREIVSELDRFIVGQADAKRAVSIALRNRWRRLQLTGSLARGGAAEKHPDDRADRRRQDRDRAAAGEAGQRALHQGRGHQVHRSRLCRPRRRADHPRPRRGRDRRRCASASARTCRPARSRPPKSACWMRWSDRRRAPPPAIPSARSCAPASSTTRKSRSRRNPPAACRCSKSRACPARRWARFRSATSSARWAGEPRPAA